MPDHHQGRTDPMPDHPKHRNRWIVTVVLLIIFAAIFGFIAFGA